MPHMEIKLLYMILFSLLGLNIGSFLNVVIYRLPLGMSLAFPSSHCPICKNKLKWYYNIPIASRLFLHGKCGFCKAPISVRYTLVELGNCLLWLFCYLLFDLSVFTVCSMLFVSLLLCIFFIDLEHTIIPDSLNVAIALLGVVLCVFANGVLDALWWERLIGCLGMLALGIGMYYISKAILKKEALGGGDIKFFAASGLFLGWKLSLLTLFVAALLGFITVVPLQKSRRLKNQPIPFGPFLAIGAAFSLFFGNRLLQAYFGLFSF